MGFASDGAGAPELVFAIFVSCLYLEHSCCLRPTVFLLGSYVSRVVEAGPFFNHVEEKIECIELCQSLSFQTEVLTSL